MSFNTRNYREREWVRLRPSLSIGFDYGQICDVLSDDRLNVQWKVNPYRDLNIHAGDVIRCGQMGEGPVLDQVGTLLHTLRAKRMKPNIPPIGTVEDRIEARRRFRSEVDRETLAIKFGLEYWLDLRRDGCDAQVEDLAETIAKVQRLLDGYSDDRARVTGSDNGGLNG